MSKSLLATGLPLASTTLHGQQLPNPASLNPSFLFVGSGAPNLSLYNWDYPTGLTAPWNGSPRATSQDPSGP
jgi:hypothetical protein